LHCSQNHQLKFTDQVKQPYASSHVNSVSLPINKNMIPAMIVFFAIGYYFYQLNILTHLTENPAARPLTLIVASPE
jgi:hypothetical protein